MSTPNLDGLEQKVNQIRGTIGNQVVNPSSQVVGSASTPLYVDANSLVAQGNVPFHFPVAGVTVTGVLATTTSTLNITGTANTDNVDLLMSGQLVGGARVTTFTKTGFIRVLVTDASGVVTNGEHYIQIGTLS